MDPLRVATLAMTAGTDPAQNRDRIIAALPAAAKAGARILLTPECALCGYPGFERPGLGELNACALADHEDLIAIRAEQTGIDVLIGSVSPWQGGWSNDAFLVGAGGPPQRYRKTCLTTIDREHFQAGSTTTVVDRWGWRIGLSICFDLRFPDTWARQALAGAEAFLHIAYMAGPDPDPGCKATIIPQHYASRAAELATPLVCCNTRADDRWLTSQAWDARGLGIAPTTDQGDSQLQCFDLPHPSSHGPWYSGIRDQALTRWRPLLDP